MKRAIVAAIGVAAAATLAVAVPAPTPAPAAPPLPKPAFFDHKIHAGMDHAPVDERGSAARGSAAEGQRGVVDETPGKSNCATCHATSANAQVAVPGARGHQPCLASGCHETDFLAAGVASDPGHDKALAFCLGCHDTPPSPWVPARPVFRSFQAELEWHVEMPGPDDPVTHGRGSHFAHIDVKNPRQDCRSCHIVKADGFLEPGTPGHGQCAVCHNESQRAADQGNAAVPADKKIRVTMSDCGGCHHEGARAPGTGRQTPGTKGDPNHVTSVRACASEGQDAIAAAVKKPASAIPCFRHERVQHRFSDYTSAKPTQELQCGQCHYMIDDQKQWAGLYGKGGRPARYFTLEDLHDNPIISNDKNREHKSCGSEQGQCHGPAFKANQCSTCHDNLSAF